MIFFDEDCNARFYPVEAGTMMTDNLDPLIDKLEQTDTAVICIGVNGQSPMYPDSKVLPSFTEGFDIAKGLDQPWMYGSKSIWAYRNAANIVVLKNQGIDSNQYLLERAKKKGMKGWISIRMNDQHATWVPFCPGHSSLWMEHPEFRTKSHFPESGLSFAHKTVRDTLLGVIQETMDRYDADGYLIDWMRHVPHFDDGTGEEQIPLINQMMEQVHQYASRCAVQRGHSIQVIARVPATISTARYHGLDAVYWAQKKWVDVLIISQKYLRSYDLDASAWKKAIGTSDFPILANIDFAYQPYPGYPDVKGQGIWVNEPIDRRLLPFVRGACRRALYLGADGIYLFNFMTVRNKGYMNEIFHDCGSIDNLTGKNFAIDITYDDLEMDEGDFLKGWRCSANDGYFRIWRAQLKEQGRYPYQLPLDIAPGETGSLNFQIGPVPEEFPQVRLRFEGTSEECHVLVNGVQCEYQKGYYQYPGEAAHFEDKCVAELRNESSRAMHILRASIFFIFDPDEVNMGQDGVVIHTGCAVDI